MFRPADLVDGLLEVTVVPSFTRLGSAARRRTDHWRPLDDYDLTGRVVVITGATSGIGRAAARQCASMGATVVILGRDATKTERVAAELRAEAGRTGTRSGTVEVAVADMSDLAAVRAAATDLLGRHPRVDVLVHNAGALDAEYVAVDGVERTVASQLVGPFLLTELLLPALKAAAPSRVLWVASGGMYTQGLTVEGLDPTPDEYDGTTAYARVKRAQVVLAEMWADRLRDDRVVVHSMHPGWADTPGVERSLPTFRTVVGPLLRTPADGADTLVWLAADDGRPIETTGRFWHDRRPRATHLLPTTKRTDTPGERHRLWQWVASRADAAR